MDRNSTTMKRMILIWEFHLEHCFKGDNLLDRCHLGQVGILEELTLPVVFLFMDNQVKLETKEHSEWDLSLWVWEDQEVHPILHLLEEVSHMAWPRKEGVSLDHQQEVVILQDLVVLNLVPHLDPLSQGYFQQVGSHSLVDQEEDLQGEYLELLLMTLMLTLPLI